MKRFILAACTCFVPVLARAQPISGPYVSLGAGVNLQQNEIITPAPTLGFDRDVIYTFHPGFAGEVSAGYGLGNGLRAEIEGDYLSNVVRGAQVDGSLPRRGGGEEKKYGGFLNIIYDADLGLPIVPYVGLGAGAQEVEHSPFSQSIQGVVGVPLPLPAGSHLGFHDQTVGGFAYQGIAGFAYPLPWVQGLSFTADYRFIGLLDPLPAFQLNVGRRVPNGAIVETGNRHFTNDFNHQILLGIRYALFQPAPPVPPSPQAAPVMAPAPELARTYLVFFDWDRADLTARARQIVAQAAEASTHVQTTHIDVNGYTDLSGTPRYNQALSVRRAHSVELELRRDGVPPAEISIKGYGESNPLVATAKGVREPQNRRVEIILH